MKSHNSEDHLLRLNAVLARFPVSRSTWYAGVKTGRYPAPVKLGLRATAWRAADIAALIELGARKEGDLDRS
ncbi:AlpA family transcriptional regulator [Acidovorax sp. sic0104]|uniref:helix-turn-helix transcriptional regulator n=1 Tax=Acidovorax sp. sic0104 TaxID=2854784 RepID=UPI001C43D64F|nr:AlpA family phage regulatory protein [Acidovorax sp. sic0104]MBV7539470.1 AlpA family phage regulatory protein [Acidovorax sp. sic0104]